MALCHMFCILLRIPLSPLFLVHLVYKTLVAYLPVNIVLFFCIFLYCTLDAIIFLLFVFFVFFIVIMGFWLLQAYIFSIYSLTSTGIKGILLLLCLSCILTLRTCFMSAAGVDDNNFYMQAGDSWLGELLYELLLQHFCWCASIGGNSIGKERKGMPNLYKNSMKNNIEIV